jgi:polyphosphate kinase 2 (PPK2 family)
MRDLWIELNQLAETIHAEGKRVAVVLEGRDGAGKSGTIRELTRYLPPYAHSVMRSFMPTKTMMKHWLSEWEKLMPRKGEIRFFDRSWYSRALLQPVMGWCTQKQYDRFMHDVLAWEQSQDVTIIKIWLSVDETKQKTLLERRANDPLRYWKHSPNDALAVGKFDELTIKKDAMFALSNDWQIVDMADKDEGRRSAVETVINSLKGA